MSPSYFTAVTWAAGTRRVINMPRTVIVPVEHRIATRRGYALGVRAGKAAISDVAAKVGFTRFHRAAQPPFNLVYEIRP